MENGADFLENGADFLENGVDFLEKVDAVFQIIIICLIEGQ